MPYYDSSKWITLQMRDRLRDLLEADPRVKAVMPEGFVIGRIPKKDVPKDDLLIAAVSIFGEDLSIEIGGNDDSARTDINPRMVLTVQRYADNSDTVDVPSQGDAYDDLVDTTGKIVRALLSYQSDPGTPGAACRLWDSMGFEPQTIAYRKMPGKFFSADVIFQLFSNQGNSQL